ncbi:hypothetical protein HS088_TW04G01463 [Tripterygium wilfordii]|uniref:Uncharacterized protein n=1 Tax=Tripterygium wilfordii TaxID=458696 RepID=A0A7J7DTL5_TRIWF|nr:hypothetical protein HS088_TW04G01463 [Tripterygium wilfordii]
MGTMEYGLHKDEDNHDHQELEAKAPSPRMPSLRLHSVVLGDYGSHDYLICLCSMMWRLKLIKEHSSPMNTYMGSTLYLRLYTPSGL